MSEQGYLYQLNTSSFVTVYLPISHNRSFDTTTRCTCSKNSPNLFSRSSPFAHSHSRYRFSSCSSIRQEFLLLKMTAPTTTTTTAAFTTSPTTTNVDEDNNDMTKTTRKTTTTMLTTKMTTTMSKLTIGIVGFGNFGQFLAKRFASQGHRVIGVSRRDYSKDAQAIGCQFVQSPDALMDAMPNVVMFCTSITSLHSVLAKFPLHR